MSRASPNLWRPRLPRSWRERGLIIVLGSAIAGMNVVYLALERLPMRVATTLQLLGPLVLALAGSRRLLDLVWAALAWAGVLLFWNPFGTSGDLSATGVLLGLASGVAMAVYVLLNKKAGVVSTDGTFLAFAVLWAAVLSLPFGVAQAAGRLLEPRVPAAGFGVALLSAVLPCALDIAALRLLPSRIVGRPLGVARHASPAIRRVPPRDAAPATTRGTALAIRTAPRPNHPPKQIAYANDGVDVCSFGIGRLWIGVVPAA